MIQYCTVLYSAQSTVHSLYKYSTVLYCSATELLYSTVP